MAGITQAERAKLKELAEKEAEKAKLLAQKEAERADPKYKAFDVCPCTR